MPESKKPSPSLRAVKKWKIADPLYGTDFYLVFGKDEALKTWLDKKRKKNAAFPTFASDTSGLFFGVDGTLYILVSSTISGLSIPTILSHEVVHLMFVVMRYVGISYCQSSEEAYAYFHAAMFDACWKKLSRLITTDNNLVKMGTGESI